MSPDATWIVIGVLAVALIAGFLYLKHKDPAEAASISATASTDWSEVKAWFEAELAKVKADMSKAPLSAQSPPAPIVAPPVAAVPTATPTGPVPTAAAISNLETATTQFHAAHANLTAAAKAVAAP